MTDEGYTPGIQQADHIADLNQEEKQEHGLIKDNEQQKEREEVVEVVEVVCRNCGSKNPDCQCVHGERTLEIVPCQ